MATRFAEVGCNRSSALYGLAGLAPGGYIASSARLIDVDLRCGTQVFIGESVIIARWHGIVGPLPGLDTTREDGFVEVGDRARIEMECCLEVFEGGHIRVGRDAIIEARCIMLALLQPIAIGDRAVIGPCCSFFPYDHRLESGKRMFDQPPDSRGPIVIEPDARLGAGVTVLSGVTVGRGAVVEPGAIVTHDVPAGARAAGAPACVMQPAVPRRGARQAGTVDRECRTP